MYSLLPKHKYYNNELKLEFHTKRYKGKMVHRDVTAADPLRYDVCEVITGN